MDVAHGARHGLFQRHFSVDGKSSEGVPREEDHRQDDGIVLFAGVYEARDQVLGRIGEDGRGEQALPISEPRAQVRVGDIDLAVAEVAGIE